MRPANNSSSSNDWRQQYSSNSDSNYIEDHGLMSQYSYNEMGNTSGSHVNMRNSSGGAGGGGDVDVRAHVVSHPLFMQLLAAHVSCLQVAARPFHTAVVVGGRPHGPPPVAASGDQHPHSSSTATAEDAAQPRGRMGTSRTAAARRSSVPFSSNTSSSSSSTININNLASHLSLLPPPPPTTSSSTLDKDELDQFMVSYILLLESFKQQLEDHLSTQATEAITACWEIERSLYDLTGVCVGPGNGSLMPENTDPISVPNTVESINNIICNTQDNVYTYALDAFSAHDIDRALIENVRQELKKELKEDYRSKLRDVRDEIMRKRRAGKLPGETTHVLKDWWNSHSKWPYPTEEDKAKLAEESGLELKQINNWFINQRKRNWQAENSIASTSTAYNPHTTGEEDDQYTANNPVNVSLSLNNTDHEDVHGSNPARPG